MYQPVLYHPAVACENLRAVLYEKHPAVPCTVAGSPPQTTAQPDRSHVISIRLSHVRNVAVSVDSAALSDIFQGRLILYYDATVGNLHDAGFLQFVQSGRGGLPARPHEICHFLMRNA